MNYIEATKVIIPVIEYAGLADTSKSFALFLISMLHVDAVARLEWDVSRLGSSFWAWRSKYRLHAGEFEITSKSTTCEFACPAQSELNAFLKTANIHIDDPKGKMP